MEGAVSIAHTLFPCAKGSEVLDSLRDDISEEFESNATTLLAPNVDIRSKP